MPAPFRWVIDRPGTPGVDAADATVFSDWIQPDDQTARLATPAFAGVEPYPPAVQTDESEYVQDPPTPEDNYPIDLNLFAARELLGWGGQPGADSAVFEHETWHVLEGYAPTDPGMTDDDPFYFMHTLRGGRTVRSRTLCAHLADTFWKDEWRGEYPDDRIVGYEVQLPEVAPGVWWPYANPISLDLNITVDPTIYDGTVLAGVAAAFALNDTWGSGPITFDPSGLDIAGRPGVDPSPTYAYQERDIGGSGALGPTVHSYTVDLAAAPPYTGLLGLHSTVKIPAFGDAVSLLVKDGIPWDIQINANVSPTGTYTIRPPRFRWIYADAVEESYRRTYPRDDGRAGGAGRTWPPSKSVQSSNRTFGGYL